MNKESIEQQIARENAITLRQALEALNTIAPLEYAIETIHVLQVQKYDCMARGKVSGKKFVWCVEVKKHFS